jgi:subtilisin family serine protease
MAEPLEARSMLSVAAGPATGPWVATDPVRPASTVLVRFEAGTPQAQQAADLDAVGGRVVTSYPDGPEVVSLPPWADRDAALARLRSDTGVAYAEADATFRADGAFIPNDPVFPQQWGMNMIAAPYAWSISTGAPGTLVAVLDTGLDLTNPEFAGRIWVNPDASTRFRTVYGWNFVNNTGNTQDDNGHGTHVTGILAAAGNNGYGIAGVDWNAEIMPLKVLDTFGNGSTDTAVAAIYYAVAHGAKVINASWGGDVFSQSMLDALNFANANGVVFVTAAGNDSSNNDLATTYPASYRTPNELVVAAVDEYGNLASYSNYGPTTVDLAAPGSDIVSTVPGGFASYTGTSMATPFVSGTVALLAGLHPGLSAAQLVALVRLTTLPLPSLTGLTVSGGVVDPYFALLGHITAASTGNTTSTALVAGGSTPETVEATILSSDSLYAALGGTPQGFVNEVFQALFGRAADPFSLAYFTNALNTGTTRMALVRILQGTPEAEQTRVARWFQDEFGWPSPLSVVKADPAVASIAGLLAAGLSDAQVQVNLLGSDGLYWALGGTPQAFITTTYKALFGRPPDPVGMAYLTNVLNTGVSRPAVVLALINTPEGHNTTIARMFIDDFGMNVGLAAMKSNPAVTFWAGYLGG